MNVSSATVPFAQSHAHAQHAHATEHPSTRANRDVADASEPKQDEKAADKRLSEEETRKINELAARDREVRAHEQAHAAVGGVHAGAPTYTFEQGPNGRKYAVGGEVSISTSPVAGDAEATIRKADQIKRAALAPAQPSAQDRAVAAQATQMKIDAQIELREQKAAELAEQLEQSESDPDTVASSDSSSTDSDSNGESSARQSIAEQLITSAFVAQESSEDYAFQAVA
ncbi:MAG: putative metalloprotease CJM1_0395 family protein [Pseudomonadales bacterium]